MGKSADSQISYSSSQCFFKLSLLCFAIFVPSLIFFCFQTFGFSPFVVTICILFVSTIFMITFSKKKMIAFQNPSKDEGSLGSLKNLQVKEVELKLNQELGAVSLRNGSQQSDIHDYQVESTDFPSASESGDDLSETENFELNWVSFNNVGKRGAIPESLDFSDDDDEEEDEDDNLIEISFSDSNSVDMNEQSKEKLQIDLPEYLSESVFRQEGLTNLLADVNEVTEEDNLIEIDLSMGSIKTPNLETEA